MLDTNENNNPNLAHKNEDLRLDLDLTAET